MNSPALDQTILFDQLQAILTEVHQKLSDRFQFQPEPAEHSLQQFTSPDGGVTGSLQTYTSTEIDWLVRSWLKMPQMGFSTMRLTAWLKPSLRVPHLAIELGTVPQLFFYIDYVPRVDLWTDLSYTAQYYEPVDPTYLALRNHADLSLFVSKGLYVRQFQSPAHLCFTGSSTEASLALIQTTVQDMSDRWLSWIDAAEPVPPEAQTALAERDLRMRRISAERDPGNAVAAKVFGAEFTEKLVRSLWQAN